MAELLGRFLCECGNPTNSARWGCSRCAAMDGSTKRQNEAVSILRTMGPLTTREFANEVGLNLNAAYYLLRRARKAGLVFDRSEVRHGLARSGVLLGNQCEWTATHRVSRWFLVGQ